MSLQITRDVGTLKEEVRQIRQDIGHFPARWASPAGGAARNGFWAMIYDKVSFEWDESSNSSSAGCPPALLPRYRGEYSWFEVEEDPNRSWRMRVKDGGRFGVAGECDAAHEVNGSNANFHLERMIVWIWRGGSISCLSSQQSSSSVNLEGHEGKGNSTNFNYWFTVNVPREDCAERYFITVAPDNDVP